MTIAPLSPLLTDPDTAAGFNAPRSNPFEIYKEDPKRYFDALVTSIDQPVVDGIAFPRFPPPAMQLLIHGHSDHHALNEAFRFFEIVRDGVAAFKPGARLLDFGAGWGRIARMFMPHFDLQNIVGFEPNAWFCQTARALNPYLTFLNTPISPPSILADASIDYVVSWSVFSHLPEHIARAWLNEFARLARPGAKLFLTTWGEAFIDKLESSPEDHWYIASVAAKLGDAKQARSRFRNGEFIYLPSDLQDYGEAWMPRAALQRLLPADLEIVTEDTTSLFQTIFVIERI